MFPSQIIYCLVFILTGLHLGCENPQPVTTSPSAFLPEEALSEFPIEEVTLDPMIIISTDDWSHTVPSQEIGGDIVLDETEITGVPLQITSDAASPQEACERVGGFLVVPILPATSLYPSCDHEQESVYIMKLINCTEQTITFTTFTFTLASNQWEDVEGTIRFELDVDRDHTNYLGLSTTTAHETGMVSFEVGLEVSPGEEEFCRVKAIRQCRGTAHLLEFKLDLTGAWAAIGSDEDEYEYVNGAVYEKSDRLVTFMSRP